MNFLPTRESFSQPEELLVLTFCAASLVIRAEDTVEEDSVSETKTIVNSSIDLNSSDQLSCLLHSCSSNASDALCLLLS
jgi:hypothetical protein